jgi:hypothetical protein
MMQPNAPESSYTLLLIETGLTLVAITGAFACPRLQWAGFRRMGNAFSWLARRKGLACITVGASMLLLRLALLPLFPVPHPFQPDDFSFLLAADTFAHGRLTNPTPALWTHFETIHITMLPTYMSMYFPGTGLVMAAGQVVFGNPWVGILLASSVMCAAICWAVQGWLPPGWALLGGLIAVLRIGLFSCWTNTYMGGGSLAAVGGALVLGALPRLTRTGRFRYGMLLGIGIAILSISRPFEGVLVCLPTAFALGRWIWAGKNRPPIGIVFRRAAAPLALIAATLAWLGYYDYRAFGSPTTLPYTVDRAAYAVAPYYVWQKAFPTPHYRHAEMQDFYTDNEAHPFYVLHSHFGMVPYYMRKVSIAFMFFAGIVLLPPVLMAARVVRDKRVRFLVWCIPVWIVGMGMGVYLMPHYLAPFTAAFYVLGLQGMRHLRVWRSGGAPVGRVLVSGLVVVCMLMAAVRVAAVPLHMDPPRRPISAWISSWIGPRDFGAQRAAIADRLEHLPGQHLIFVRYTPEHDSVDEWVYNAADMDSSRIIWAQEMDAASNAELMRHYSGRDVWLVQPDVQNGTLSPYTMGNQLAAR